MTDLLPSNEVAVAEISQLLESKIGYRFRRPKLAIDALTHRSASQFNNERLEYLGDAVLSLAIGHALYERHPHWSEGDLTRVRSSLVRRDTLAALARKLGIGALLSLGVGERRSGGFQRRSILEDALEALIGAVFLDGGWQAADTVVNRIFTEHLEHLPDPNTLKDPKTKLQERLQSRHVSLPVYKLLKTQGPDHARQFFVLCRVEALGIEAEGTGDSRRKAEQAAAAAMLERIGHDG